MAVTLSVDATLYRSTTFDRSVLRHYGLNSNDGKEEFSASIGFANPLDIPNLPISIVTPNVTHITFLAITVTGGTVTVRLSKNAPTLNTIDLPITNGTIILSGIDLENVTVISYSGKSYFQCIGAGY